MRSIVVASVGGVVAGIVISAVVPHLMAEPRRRPGARTDPQQAHASYVATFRAEKVDPEWARRTEPAITSWFAEAATRGLQGRVTKAECRTHSCLVNLRWKDRNAAQSELDQLLPTSAPAVMGCTSLIYLPPERGSPYEASLVVTGCPEAAVPGSRELSNRTPGAPGG